MGHHCSKRLPEQTGTERPARISRRPRDKLQVFRFAHRARTGGKAGVANPVRTLPLSVTLAGAASTRGKAGVAYPIRTVPSSLIAGGGIFTVLMSFTVFSNI
jgi:hypothetical protein